MHKMSGFSSSVGKSSVDSLAIDIDKDVLHWLIQSHIPSLQPQTPSSPVTSNQLVAIMKSSCLNIEINSHTLAFNVPVQTQDHLPFMLRLAELLAF